MLQLIPDSFFSILSLCFCAPPHNDQAEKRWDHVLAITSWASFFFFFIPLDSFFPPIPIELACGRGLSFDGWRSRAWRVVPHSAGDGFLRKDSGGAVDRSSSTDSLGSPARGIVEDAVTGGLLGERLQNDLLTALFPNFGRAPRHPRGYHVEKPSAGPLLRFGRL